MICFLFVLDAKATEFKPYVTIGMDFMNNNSLGLRQIDNPEVINGYYTVNNDRLLFDMSLGSK